MSSIWDRRRATMHDSFDVGIVGGGIIGLLAAWFAGILGRDTILFEQHCIDQPKGSSRGSSRMFGEAHAKDIYFQLAHRSRYWWQNLERETGRKLLFLCSGLDIGVGAEGRKNTKELASKLRSRGMPFETLDGATLRRQCPQWRCNSNISAVYSEQAGILAADSCMDAAINAVRGRKVVIQGRSRVISIDAGNSSRGVVVKLSSGKICRTRKLIITAGPWTRNILAQLGVSLPLRISQEQTVYFLPRRNAELFKSEIFPVWEWSGSDFIYGFPTFENDGIKVAFHSDGRYLKNLAEFRRTPRTDVTRRLKSFLNKHLPDAAGEAFGSSTCLYTNTPDDDFVIDAVPSNPNIVYFTGESGHAFHCAPAVSKTLIELACEGKTEIDVSCFSVKRF